MEAVALKYPENAEAPFIAARARGKMAEKIIAVAEEKGIPIIKDRMLSKILIAEDVGSLIPVETYAIVAKIFAFIENIGDIK